MKSPAKKTFHIARSIFMYGLLCLNMYDMLIFLHEAEASHRGGHWRSDIRPECDQVPVHRT
jgi:hypothetical protein